ncbi:MAG: hypothetical protein COW62_05500 [Zetaproteobacteria bacterium CG17_big_fil_post_rev_8_21_14_2_50_50_13]|nr:MAG: hypothetical protein COW62_05500 [Zetaproteobacteria bacterium CG17_big_fil_post_rev_8_21_14_2_50_50_13]PIY57011.1 MAG: hypothetical protein COZ00_01165 [Zetaproteobacteria bacterium CG_4_10_14_0_8_um_filter_49_80]
MAAKQKPDVELHNTLAAIRGLSDLLCNNMDSGLSMVKPENLESLISILADRLEAAIGFAPGRIQRPAAQHSDKNDRCSNPSP